MGITIGIPRALLYYKYSSLWETFFNELGVEVKISPHSNKSILKKGLALAESEICLPVKAFFGHVVEVSKDVDLLFIPRMVGVENKEYTCPKFLGLPDMVRACDHPVPEVLSPLVDLRQGRKQYYRTVIDVGRIFNNKLSKILGAYHKSLKDYKIEKKAFKDGQITYLEKDEANREASLPTGVKIAVLGHPYNIYDTYTSLNLIRRLQKMGIEVVTADMISNRVINSEAAKLPKKLFWTYEKEIVGAALYWLRKRNVDGVIYVLSFACGPDSLIELLLSNKYKEENKIPLMSLVLDEHASETGIMTRLEAFVDMITRKKKIKQRAVV